MFGSQSFQLVFQINNNNKSHMAWSEGEQIRFKHINDLVARVIRLKTSESLIYNLPINILTMTGMPYS